MTFDWLTTPVDDDMPCGPDLEQVDDPAFIDYYYEAEARMPERYFLPGAVGPSGEGVGDRLFDPKSIDIKREQAEITSLVKRSRDIRPLSLLARFGVLAGRGDIFADALDAIATLLEIFPDQTHPRVDSGVSDRRGALDELASAATVLSPLAYLPLAGAGEVTLRKYKVASGQSAARRGEDDLVASALLSALANPSHAQAVETTHKNLSIAKDAVARIHATCLAHHSHPFTPSLGPLDKTLKEALHLIAEARTDLVQNAQSPVEAAKNTVSETATPTSNAQSMPVALGDLPCVASHVEAKQVLEAIEAYFCANEPASAAILLVTQARLLIGRPLIEALETLMPDRASKAIINLGTETGFALSIDRLRSLSGEIKQPPQDETTLSDPPKISSRVDIARYLQAIETYFRSHEPASPLPLLLVKARMLLEKDFQAIIQDILPVEQAT